jgi:alpha-L-fucosidase 2
MWMSLEDGDIDVAGIGFWMDHIFAMGTIARSAWTQWQYSGDRDWLAAKGYPVIRNCALFFRNNWIVEEGDGVARIGRCTDLERLGPSRDRAFMTTCGAIYAMRAAADAAAILSTNREESVDFRAAADRLERGLPVSKDGTRYVAYENCEEESVGTLAGLYPFPIFGADNARQASAARHFLAAGKSAGNMYPMGKSVCPWYAGKMAASLVALGDRSEPYRWLSEAAGAQGLFGETWEINEPGLRIHPWFTTASGTCAYALAQMLLSEIDGVLHIAPGVPTVWKDYSFSLPAPNGVWVDCEVKGGEIVKLEFRALRKDASAKVPCLFNGKPYGN